MFLDVNRQPPLTGVRSLLFYKATRATGAASVAFATRELVFWAAPSNSSAVLVSLPIGVDWSEL
jgi:hypothetical protein